MDCSQKDKCAIWKILNTGAATSLVTLACSRTSLLWHLLQNLTLAPEIKWSANPSDGDKVKSFKNADVWGFCIWLPRRHYRGAGERGRTILHLLETRSLVFAAAEESLWAHLGERRIDQTRTLFLPDKDIFASYLPGLFTYPSLSAMQQADRLSVIVKTKENTQLLEPSVFVYHSKCTQAEVVCWPVCTTRRITASTTSRLSAPHSKWSASNNSAGLNLNPELYIRIHIYDYIQFIQWINK